MLRASRIHRFARNYLPVSCLPGLVMPSTGAKKLPHFLREEENASVAICIFCKKMVIFVCWKFSQVNFSRFVRQCRTNQKDTGK